MSCSLLVPTLESKESWLRASEINGSERIICGRDVRVGWPSLDEKIRKGVKNDR